MDMDGTRVGLGRGGFGVVWFGLYVAFLIENRGVVVLCCVDGMGWFAAGQK